MSFTVAFAMGFAVASIPGPIAILILSETLRKGVKAGLSAMAAPVALDALFILPLGLSLQAALLSGKGATYLSIVGAGFVAWLGVRSLQRANQKIDTRAEGAPTRAGDSSELSPFAKAALAHLTSPYPYIYWGTVGASFVRYGSETGGIWSAAIFPLGLRLTRV